MVAGEVESSCQLVVTFFFGGGGLTLPNYRNKSGSGSWKRRVRSDADTDADTNIFKKEFYIYITVIFHT